MCRPSKAVRPVGKVEVFSTIFDGLTDGCPVGFVGLEDG